MESDDEGWSDDLNINELPSEIFSHIFNMLSTGERCQAFRVCRKWLDEGTHAGWTRLSFEQEHAIRVTDSVLAHFATFVPQLSVLRLAGCSKVTGKGLTALQPYLAQLQTLDLSGCTLLGNEDIALVATACPDLNSLDIRGLFRLTDDGLSSLASLTSLRHLWLRSVRVTQAGIHTLLRGIGAHVETLHLWGPLANNTCDAGLLDDVATFCKGDSLTDLLVPTLSAGNSAAEFNRLTSNCPNLRRLWVKGVTQLPEDALSSISSLTSLSHLAMPMCETLGASAMTKLAQSIAATPEGEGLDASLTELDLYMCAGVDDEAVQVLTKALPSLRMLTLPSGDRITDASIEAVADNCKHLGELRVFRPGTLGDESVARLLAKCPTLHSLILEGVPITDFAFIGADDPYPSLRRLNLTLCSGVTNDGIVALCANAPRLQRLNLNRLSRLTDAVVDALSSLTDLQALNLRGTGVTINGILNLAAAAPSLRKLDVVNNPTLDEQLLHELRQLNPHLDVVWRPLGAVSSRESDASSSSGGSGGQLANAIAALQEEETE